MGGLALPNFYRTVSSSEFDCERARTKEGTSELTDERTDERTNERRAVCLPESVFCGSLACVHGRSLDCPACVLAKKLPIFSSVEKKKKMQDEKRFGRSLLR